MPEERDIIARPSKRVEQLIFTDDLTGVFNRRYLYQFLPQEVNRCQISKQNLWLFMIDVDDFKEINDTYGHLKGDEVLKGVADILKESVRSADTVIRYAGDEFTVIISSAEMSTANAVAKRIMTKINNKVFHGEAKPEFRVHLSIGIANLPTDATEALSLINMADKALYASKQKGKNCISFVGDLPADMLIAHAILDIFPCHKIIERERHIEALRGSFGKIQKEKKAQAILVSGGVGTGKSRLIEEFLKVVKSQNFFVVMHRCSEKSAPHPFHSAFSIWAAFLRTNKIAKDLLLSGLSTEERAALGKSSLSIKNLYGITEKAIEELKVSEGQVLGVLNKISVNIVRQSKLCMVIDDFQWTDIGTLNLIATLKGQEIPLFICCLIREDELQRPQTEMPLVQFKNDLVRFFSEKITVENLPPIGTVEMIRNIFTNLEADEEFFKLIYKVTQGNPLFVEELLKFLVQRGFLVNREGKWSKIDLQESDLPHSLQDVILERIKGLDKPVQEIIAKAAVIGQDFNSEILGRLDKADEGYILDILESAKRVGLIRENLDVATEDPSANNMSFANEEIRKAISELIGREEIMNLHHQVGEIQENLHADNLSGVAADLFYHFKKSQDFEKAKRYADMIQEGGEVLQDRAIEYAKRILEEREEKVYPLSKKSQKLIPEVGRLFYIININTGLYPSGSEMITEPLDGLFSKLSEIFSRDDMIVFKDYKEALLVNGEKLKEFDLKNTFSRAIISLFKERNIESITFKRGVSKNELITFFDNFTTIREDKTISEILKSKLIFKIKVKEVDYAAISGEKIQGGPEAARLWERLFNQGWAGTVKGEDILNRLKTQPQEITQLLMQSANSIVKNRPPDHPLGDEKLRVEALANSIQKIGEQIDGSNIREIDNYRKGLATAITQLDSPLRKQLLSHERFNSSQNDVVKEIAPYFSDEVILDVFAEELSQNKASSARLKSLVSRFLPEEKRRKGLLPKIKDKLHNLGLSKEDSEWVFGEKKWGDLGLEEQLNKFLQMSVKDYLSLEQEVDVANLGREIIRQGRRDLLERFLRKWDDFFKVGDFNLRKLIVMNFSGIVESIPLCKEETLGMVINFVFSLIQKESHPEIYALFISQLSTPLDYLLSAKYFKELKSFLSQLDKERARFESGIEHMAIQALYDKIVDKKQIDHIINELFSRIDKNLFYSDISDIIILIGEIMVKPLLGKMLTEEIELSHVGYFGVYLRKRAIGEILSAIAKRKGYQTIATNLQEKINSQESSAVKNAVDLIIYLQEPELCSLLSGIIKYPEGEVRKKVAFALSKSPTAQNISFLNGMLKDEDAQVRLQVINLLAKAGDKSSLRLLKDLRDPENQEVLKVARDILERKMGQV